MRLSQETLDGLLEIFDRVAVPIFHRMYEAVRDMFVDNHLAETSNSGIDRGELDQNVGTVLIVLDHILHFLQMTDDPGQSVQHFFLMLRGMIVPVYMGEMSLVVCMLICVV